MNNGEVFTIFWALKKKKNLTSAVLMSLNNDEPNVIKGHSPE